MKTDRKVDVVVVGAGHAGCEAAHATAKMGFQTLLITLTLDKIALMPCNPSIGGPAKGVVVKEIEALGGLMGQVADETAIQFKMLNTSKGPGVQCLRLQSDKPAYGKAMRNRLEETENLTLLEDMVTSLITEDQKVVGVHCRDAGDIFSRAVILTTGTYMASQIMISSEVKNEGVEKQETTNLLSDNLRSLGLELFRLKTGTPARLYRKSVDLSKTLIQPGDHPFKHFSLFSHIDPDLDQVPCYLTYTNETTHQIIRDNLNKSSMYAGVVHGVGARYCPSIEDKVVRFADKNRHQIFLEPECKEFDTIYVQGLSSSLPRDVQAQVIHSVAGLENAEIKRYGFAIEYDAINPLQTQSNLENRLVENLFTAGQINGTSGYEEAAGQGLMAGINAGLKLQGKSPFILRRDEAYIGVMIDDLVTKGTKEPYRLLTSRSEYRLLTRHDNAYRRLVDYGYQFKLVDEDQYQYIKAKIKEIEDLIGWCKHRTIKSEDEDLKAYLASQDLSISSQMTLFDLMKRPTLDSQALIQAVHYQAEPWIVELAAIEMKYEGYIIKAKKEADRLKGMDHVLLGEDFDYDKVDHLATEARQKLKAIMPHSLGQASRISGVNPSDLMMLSIYLKKKAGI